MIPKDPSRQCRSSQALAVVLSFGAFLMVQSKAAAAEVFWPQWRGPEATGVAPLGNPPLEWSETKNIRWKVKVPGRGHASPIVWGDRIYLATAIPAATAPTPPPKPPAAPQDRRPRGVAPEQPQRFVLMALDRETGKVVWERVARENLPHEGTHLDATWASASPVTDGEVVVAQFGSNGLYVYNLGGKLLWSKDLGDMQTRNGFGEGSSPALHGDTLVVNWDHEGESFVVALDKNSGREHWRQPRDEVTSWATPLVVERGGKVQVIVSATNRVRSYELATGKVLWEAAGMTTNTIPSPVERDGVVYAMSGFRGNNLLAIRLDGAQGDVTGTEQVLWTYDRDTPYVPSPLLYGDQLYFLKHNRGIVSALDIKTGSVLFGPERLEGIEGAYASPVGAAGRVYVVGRNGVTVVLKHGEKLELLATNTLEDGFDASPAIAENDLFLRGRQYLYRIAETPVAPPSEKPAQEGSAQSPPTDKAKESGR